MITIVLSIVALLLGCFLCLVFRKYAWGLFNLIWSVVLFLCRDNLCKEYYSQTLWLLLLMIVMVNVGCVLGGLPITITTNSLRSTPSGAEIFQGRLLRQLLELACIIFLYFALRTVVRFGFDLALIRAANNSDSAERVFTGLIDTIMFYGVAMPMVYVGALCAAYNLSQGIRTPKSIYILLGADMLLYVLAAGGRSIFIRVALFFAAALLLRLKNVKRIRAIRIAQVCLAVVVLLFLMEALTASRNSSDISFLNQAITYVRGSVSHMQYQLNRISNTGSYAGYVTYGGFLYYPVKIISKLFGLEWQTSNEIMAFLQEYKYISIGSGRVYYNALVPNAFYYYYDSGYVGVVLFSVFLGIGICIGERSWRRPTFLRFVLLATAVYAIVYSPLDGVLWAFRYPTALIYCTLLHKRIYKTAEPEHGG